MSTSPFQVPDQLKVYDSDAIDPTYQLYYTYAWTSFTGLVVLWGLPRAVRRAKRSWEYGTWKGVSEGGNAGWMALRSEGGDDEVSRRTDATMGARIDSSGGTGSRVRWHTHGMARAILGWHISIPSLSGLKAFNRSTSETNSDLERRVDKPSKAPTFRLSAITVGQLIVVVGYIVLVCVTVFNKSELNTNANRPGYIALSMLTPLLLLSTPSSPLTSLLTSSYPTLNLMHRLIGILLFLSITLHGAIWTHFYTLGVGRGTGGLGSASGGMGATGWGAWGMVFVLAASGGVRRLRRVWFELFKVIHFIAFIVFFVLISFHTSTSRPWIYPPIALYTADLFFKLIRFKFQDAYLIDIGGGMTMIHLPYVQTGFYPTQHLNLRLLSHDRFNMFQSHPLTITTSASGSGSGPDGSRSGLTLYAKSVGGWTGRLNNLATASTRNKPYGSRSTEILFIPGRGRVDATPVQVILDGPYGGLDVELDLMRYEEVLMVAGGSGITFVLGAMEGVLDGFRRTSREGEKRGSGSGSRKLRSISVVWSVRDPSMVIALIPTLEDLHQRLTITRGLEMKYTIHLTSSPTASEEDKQEGKERYPHGPDRSILKSSGLDIEVKFGRMDVTRVVEDHLDVIWSGLDRPYDRSSAADQEPERGPVYSHSEPEPGPNDKARPRSSRNLGVIACGPKQLVLETRQSVLTARTRSVKAGRVGWFGEIYSS